MTAVRPGVSIRRLAFGVRAKRALVRFYVVMVVAWLGLSSSLLCATPLLTIHDVLGEAVRVHVRGASEPASPPSVSSPWSSPWRAYAARSIGLTGLGVLGFLLVGRFRRWAATRAQRREARELFGSLAIGRDGLRIKQYVRERFVSYAELESLGATRDAIVVGLADGARIVLPCAEPEALRVEVERARTRYAPFESEPLPADTEAVLRASVLLSRSYREGALSHGALADQACAMGATPVARIAAALALARDGATATTLARVRASLDEMANEDLARAIETALEPAPDRSILDRALR